jgi:NADPH:quinone reductase-like Zn-dependent oxidoreductase
MKAIVLREYGGPDVLRYEEIARPEPGPGEVLVKVRYVSVNITLDIILRKGIYARKPPLPHVLGCDPTGEIVAVGKGVPKSRVGQRVFIHTSVPSPQCKPGHEARDPGPMSMIGIHRWGGYAEYVAVPAAVAFTLPKKLSFEDATVIMRHLPTARHLVGKVAKLRRGEWVLIMGASGGLASCCIQVAKRIGAKVIGAAGADDRVRKGIEFGADHGINYRTQNLAEEARKITGGLGVHVVTDSIGDPELFPAAFDCLRRFGRLVTAGAHAGGMVTLDLRKLYLQTLSISGDPSCDSTDIKWALAAARDGSIRAPIIDRVLPLSQAAEAHRLVEQRAVTGKILLDATK